MKKLVLLSVFSLLVFGLCLVAVSVAQAADDPAVQTKTGVVKKVDLQAKTVVVMVARELTFTVTDATKILQGEAAKTLADVKVGAKVTVDYTRAGETRTATRITINADAPAQ